MSPSHITQNNRSTMRMCCASSNLIGTILLASSTIGWAFPTASTSTNTSSDHAGARAGSAFGMPVLSEVNSGSMDWVELYNPSFEVIDLTNYTLHSKTQGYTFKGDCSSIAADSYILLVDKDAINPEYRNGDCKLPFGIKKSGQLHLLNAAGDLLESVVWSNTAYVAGHSYAKTDSGEWAATSTQTPFARNIFTEEITMPTSVDFSSGLHDRNIAYIQAPAYDSITNVNLRVYETSDECECWQFQEAHNDEKCTCTWDSPASENDVLSDATSTDLKKAVMPCSVSINVDGEPEYWYEKVNANSSERLIRADDNCNVAVRGGFSRDADIKSFNIKINKKIVPRTWRGLKRLNMVKLPYEFAGGAVTATLMEQFAKVHNFNGMRNTVANLTVTVINPATGEVSDVQNMGRYALFENLDEDALDRHGQAARTPEGDRLESHLYKLNSFDFTWYASEYADMPAIIDETNEDAIAAFSYRLEAKDSKNTLKLLMTMKDLNGLTNMSFTDAVHEHFDLSNLATFIAVNLVCGDPDHKGKNSYIYSTTGTEKWYMTPWDYDASWTPIMDQGPAASTIQRYQDHYLFRGILATEELRNEFIPLLKQSIRTLQGELFEKDTIEKLITKHAAVVEPFFALGKVDRDILGTRPWDDGTSVGFQSENLNWDLSPRANIMGQFAVIMEAIENYTFADPPPSVFAPIYISKGSNNSTYRVSQYPMFSPVGNEIKTMIEIYKNRPFEGRNPIIQGNANIYEDRFYAPKEADVVRSETVPSSLIAETPFKDTYSVELNCTDVQECANTQCYVTMYTIDMVTNERSVGAAIRKQGDFNDSGCF